MSDPVPNPAPAAPAPQPPAAAPAAAPAPAPAAPAEVLLTIDEFKKVKLATAKVLEARPHPKADRLLILQLEVGTRRKQIVSGIREHYTPEQMVGKTIIIADNLAPAKLRGETSEGMLLAVQLPGGGLRILTTDGEAPSGLSVS
jgi:methionyl-tRNA synthetase